MTDVSTSGFGTLFARDASKSYGTQAAWAIDPATGNDSNLGTPSEPLATMAEFNERWELLKVTGATTLQLVGNVLDSALQLSGTRFASGSSLTVSGTLTDVATGTVSSSTTLGNSGWQLTTTGINWTGVAVSSHVRFSTGQVAAIAEIVDANNVIIGCLGAPGTGVVTAAPTNGSTVTVATRSRMVEPQINALGQSIAAVNQLIIQSVSLDAGATGGGLTLNGGVRVQFYGCEINNQNTMVPGTSFNARCCKFTLTATMSWQTSSPPPSTNGCVVGGAGSTLFNHQAGTTLHNNLLMTGSRLSMNGPGTAVQVAVAHIRNSAGPILVSSGAQLLLLGGTISGSTGNTGIGIDVTCGRVVYIGGANKPTVTGASDTRVGGTAKAYSAIPYTALDATAPTNLVGNGSCIVQE